VLHDFQEFSAMRVNLGKWDQFLSFNFIPIRKADFIGLGKINS